MLQTSRYESLCLGWRVHSVHSAPVPVSFINNQLSLKQFGQCRPVQLGTVTRCCVIRCYHCDLSLRHTPCALKFAMQCAKHKLPKTTLFFIFCFYLRLKPIDCLNAHPVSLHEMPLQTTERSVVQTVSSECNDNANVLCSDQCWNNESYNLLLDQAQAATCARCTPSCGYLRTRQRRACSPAPGTAW